MLAGADIAAFVAIVSPFKPLALGLNCSGGPDELASALEELAALSPLPLCFMPNAGLPCSVNGCTSYPFGPDLFAEKVEALARRFGVAVVGGCCGTSPAHIAELNAWLSDRPSASPPKAGSKTAPEARPAARPALSSLYKARYVGPGLFKIGERANSAGSAAFANLLKAENFEAWRTRPSPRKKAGLRRLISTFPWRVAMRRPTSFASSPSSPREPRPRSAWTRATPRCWPKPFPLSAGAPSSTRPAWRTRSGQGVFSPWRPIRRGRGLPGDGWGRTRADGGRKSTHLPRALRYGHDRVRAFAPSPPFRPPHLHDSRGRRSQSHPRGDRRHQNGLPRSPHRARRGNVSYDCPNRPGRRSPPSSSRRRWRLASTRRSWIRRAFRLPNPSTRT